jgi:MFS family permease
MASERLFTRPFLLCFAANLVQGVAFNLFLHFPGFLKQLGSNEIEVGLLSSLTAVAAIGVRPWVGRTMDSRGRRPVILMGAALNVLVVGLYLTVRGIGPWIYLLRVGHGLAEAMLFASLFTYAADYVPAARRTQGLAIFGVSGMLPISLGGLLGDWLLSHYDYAALFQVAFGFAVVALLLSFPLRDEPHESGAREPSRAFLEVLTQRDLVPLWFVGAVFSVALAAVFVFVKLFVEETGLGSVGLFFTSYTAVALVFRVFFGWLPDRIGPKRVLFPALATLTLGFVMLALAADPTDVAVAGALCGAGHGYTFPILFGMVVTRARDAERGAAMSIFTALFDAGVLVGGPLFGWTYGQRLLLAIPSWGLFAELTHYALLYAVGALILAAGSVAYAILDRGREA